MPKPTPVLAKTLMVMLAIALILALAPAPTWAASPTIYPVPRSQADRAVVTVALPGNIANRVSERVITDFEAAYPGLTLKVIENAPNLPNPTQDIETYFTELGEYAAVADVLYVDNNRMRSEATVAGYYLDLASFVAEDTTLGVEDFFPAAWSSFQWDKGTWALPFGIDSYILTYDPAAFDDAALAYPAAGWSFDDLINAATTLVQKDGDGKVTRAGLDLFSAQADAYLFRSLLGASLFDPSVVPYAPQLVNVALEEFLTRWQELEADGTVTRSFNVAPMSISPAFSLALPVINADGQTAQPRQGILLPGSSAGLDVQGLGISAGTTKPKEAYTVAAFLTTRPELSGGGRFTSTPARRSLVGQSANDGPGPRLTVSDEVQALVLAAAEAGISLADLRFFNYVTYAYNKMKGDRIDARTALQEAEALAQQNQQAALDRKPSVAIVVAPPPDNSPVTADGRTRLKVSLVSLFGRGGLPNQEAWDEAIAAFVATDPAVGAVELQRGRGQLAQVIAEADCAYLPSNQIPNADLSTILALDPFVDADPSFDKSDVVGDVLTQLTRDGKLWAYPFGIEPAILKYNATTFDKSGAATPIAGWTIDEFSTALRTIKVFPEDPAPFADNGTGGVSYLILAAAYGGLPLDFRTNPPTVAYTDPANVDAIRQVLELAKDGYLQYNKLASFLGAGVIAAQDEDNVPAITTDNLNAFGFQFFRRGGPGGGGGNNNQPTTDDVYGSTTFPRGTLFTGASYTIGIGVISATTQSAEGCYRFFNAIAGNAKLFQSMPARRSLINDPSGVAAQQGADVVAVYNEMDAVLADPSTIIFPAQFTGGTAATGFLLQYWLYTAFDKYVLEEADLETELATAQQYATEFQACSASIPQPVANDPAAARDYLRQIGTCAVGIDPTLEPIFALIR
jgi:ABC-type glycerol-3-phosphate transport system substrate-binding protein